MVCFKEIIEYRIDSIGHYLFSEFYELYESSFPLYERRDEEGQLKAFQDERYRLIAWKDGGVFLGFIAYWKFTDYLYIEHYAINPALRGKGLGANFLKKIMSENVVILKIDPVFDFISLKRLDFYLSLDSVMSECHHIHPSYHKELGGHELKILSSQAISDEIRCRFQDDLENVVMNLSSTHD